MRHAKTEGIYECFIAAIDVEKYKQTSKLTITLKIRSDVPKKGLLRDTNGKWSGDFLTIQYWQKKATRRFNIQNLQILCYACGVPEHLEINGVNGLKDILIGRQVQVLVKNEYDSYLGSKVSHIAPWNIKPTAIPNLKLLKDYRQTNGYDGT